MMVRLFAVVLAMLIASDGPSQAQPSRQPACGARLDGKGTTLTFASPLPEEDRIGLMASIHLALNDRSGRGTWPTSEIDIALPCQIANFPVGEDTWEISAGEGFAPPRWARAKGHDETYFLAPGPSLAEARAWAADPNATVANLPPSIYYLAATTDNMLFVFKAYQGSPDGKRLADDIFDVIAGKTPPIAAYDPKGTASSLFLLTQSRRTSHVYRPDRLTGDLSAKLYGPDGYFFSPMPGEAVLLRGSDLTCDDRHGEFTLTSLSVIRPEDQGLDLSCHYEGGESFITIFSSHLPDVRDDRRIFDRAIKNIQDDGGVAMKLQSFNTGTKQILQAGKSWVDKSGAGQGLWIMRRGEYVYEIRATFTETESKATLAAVKSFALSTEPEPAAR